MLIIKLKEIINSTGKTIAIDLNKKILYILLFLIGLTIIIFNIVGYKELLNEPVLGLITPFGFLIGLIELAVLFWTAGIIRNFKTANWILKLAIIPVFFSFWLLCFTGINSYLKKHSYSEVKELQAAKIESKNNNIQLKFINEQLSLVQVTLDNIKKENNFDNDRITELQVEANQISTKMSKRRLGSLVCDRNIDCKEAISDYKQQIDNIQQQIDQLHGSVVAKQQLIADYQSEISDLIKNKKSLSEKNRELMNLHAQTEGSFSVKKQTYEDIVIKVFNLLGLSVPKEPYSYFIAFISLIIYPIYFLLNLYLNLDSDVSGKLTNKKTSKSSHRKLFKYLRVWAHRRQKTRNVPVIREVEKVVEKEVAVYVDRIQKISEPMIVSVPEPIIHERLIPVPEDISAKDLAELMTIRSERSE